jgi:ankyrin repeat protein
MSFLYRFYQAQPIQYRRVILNFFFHGNGDPLQKSQLGLFRSLVCQLYRQSLYARQTILTAFKSKKESGGKDGKAEVFWTLNELQSLFSDILLSKQMKENEVTILIDALDEATDQASSKAAPSLLKFLHQLNDSIGLQGGKIKICISCRQYPVVAVNSSGLQISIQEENRQDIEKYVSYQLRIGVEGWELQSLAVQRELEEAIVDKADGVFLWVVKRLERIVEDLNDGVASLADTKRLLESESNDLSVLYESILTRDIKKGLWEKSLLFMQWVCLSERPLNLTEFRMAMACDEKFERGQEKVEDSVDFVESDERMEKLIRSLSGGLAEVKCGVVQLFHQSVTDFLRERGIKTLFAGTIGSNIEHWTDERIWGLSQDRLSKCCLRYLGFGVVGKIPLWASGILVSDFKEVEVQFPFMSYATLYAFVHAERAEAFGVPHEYLVEVLEPEPGVQKEILCGPGEMIGRSPSAFVTWKSMFSRICRFEGPREESSLIHVAACFNLQSVIRHTVEFGCSINQGDEEQRTALHFAAQLGHESTTLMLLNLGADIEARTETGRTPLAVAVANGHESVGRLLIRKGAKVNTKDGQFANMLQAACYVKGSIGLVTDLVDYGATINGQTEATSTALQEAAFAGNEEVVRFLIYKGADVNAKGSKHGSALHAAVQAPDPQREVITRLLLDKKSDVNAQGGEFGSPLQAAAQANRRRNAHIMMMLLNEGASVNARGGRYGTALQAACTKSDSIESVECVKLLLAMGADVNIQGGEFETALQAAAACNPDAVPVLLASGADVNAEGGHYGCALQAAATAYDTGIFKLLLAHGARTDIKGGFHGNPLQAAAGCGNNEIMTILLDLGADINEQGGQAGNALQAAIQWCPEPFIKFLLDRGADVNLQGGEEGNALGAALIWRKEPIIKLLLDHGADMHACIPKKHESAFQLALGRGDLKIVKLLLDHGKNNNPKDEWYIKAVERTKCPGKELLAELLLQWRVRTELLSLE